jgi:hypothetical protein
LQRPKWLSLAYYDSLKKKLAGLVAGLTALVVLITGIVTLVDHFLPKPLQARRATLTGVQFIAQEPLKDYLRETGGDPTQWTSDALKQTGRYYIVRVRLEGLRNHPPNIVWSMHNRGQRRLLQPAAWLRQKVSLPPDFKPPADTYEFAVPIFIQRPSAKGQFYVVLEVDYPQFKPLAIAISKDFTVTRLQHPSYSITEFTQTYVPVTTISRRVTTVRTTSTGTTTTETTVPTTVPATTTLATTTTEVTTPNPLVRPEAVPVQRTSTP